MITFNRLSKSDYKYFSHINNDSYTLSWMESDREYKREDFDVIMCHKSVRWYIIYDDDKKVGLFTAYKSDNKLYLGIIIDSKQRRKGYARKAFNHYLRATDSLGYITHLGCFIDQPALPLYRELGYIETGRSKIVRDRLFIEMMRIWKN